MERVTKKVQDWFCDKAKYYQWDEAIFSGNQCILRVKMDKRELPED